LSSSWSLELCERCSRDVLQCDPSSSDHCRYGNAGLIVDRLPFPFG
jgi:hypothetical protein